MNYRSLSDPRVSVVIPFYHSYTQYLEECLLSVCRQTYSNWEAIIVDDASLHFDQATRIVEALDDSRIKIVRHEQNRGQAAARNTGIRLGAGEFFVPLDCDDHLDPSHIEKLVQALDVKPDCSAAYTDYHLFSAITADLELPVRDTRSLLREQWIPHPGTLVRRSLWERTQGYPEDEAFRVGNEDWDFWLSAAEVGLKATRVPEPLYHYRQHANSISSRRFGYADYLTREIMYVRHRELFDGFRMKRPFLAGGYRVSGKAFWDKGERLRGLKLLLHSVWLSPNEFTKAALRKVRGLTSVHS
jgi:glycosyltransferase involved in cell wall biosynthesis